MSDREVLALVDAAVEDCRKRLLEVGYLKRLNNTQRRALGEAHKLILSLPATIREAQDLGTLYRKERDAKVLG